MSHLWKLKDTKELVENLREKEKKSTPVVGWYDHVDTVRGPWNRWFKVLNPETERQEGTKYPHTLPPGSDDVAYCAAAMNAGPHLIEAYDRLTDILNCIEKGEFKNGEKALREEMRSLACNVLSEVGFYE